MEYSKEQILRLADSLEICADPKRGCGECMLDKTCDRYGETGCAVLREGAKVIREFVEEKDAFLSLVAKIKFPKPNFGVTLEAIEARLGKCNNREAADNSSVSCADSSLCTREPLKGQAWQMGLYERAIEKFGAEKQVTKAVEEMGELIVELSRWQIDHQTEDKHLMAQIREELADVCIMCDQLQLIFGDVSDWEMYKLERLERKLERGL